MRPCYYLLLIMLLPFVNPGAGFSQSPPVKPQVKLLEQGRQLFFNNCASCHAIDRDIVAPKLAYISSRRDKKWLYAFTRNSQKLIADGDRYANCLFVASSKTLMVVFPVITDQALDAIYAYIENESRRRALPMPDDHLKKCSDSCAAYSRLLTAFKKANKQQVPKARLPKPPACDCSCGTRN